MIEASKQVDPESQPVDLVSECTKLLAQLTEAELALHISSSFQDKPAEEQLLIFYRVVRCVHTIGASVRTVHWNKCWFANSSPVASIRIPNSRCLKLTALQANCNSI